MSNEIVLSTPITNEQTKKLKFGDKVYISGAIYTARDAAHKRIVELIERKAALPFDFEGQVVYYAGPSPSKPDQVIGSIGPTTSGRMDAYSPKLIELGLKYMIGKGIRDKAVSDAIIKHKGVYFAAVGGAAALMSKCVTSSEIVDFEDLGTEAIRKLTVCKLPLIVAIDTQGNCVYK